VVDFFYLEVKKMRPSCSEKINSARHNLLDLKERGSKSKKPNKRCPLGFRESDFSKGVEIA
jgi:hypothetical protein